MRLTRATAGHRGAFLEMAREWRAAGDDRYAEALSDFQAYLTKLEAGRLESVREDKRVPGTSFWLINDDGRVLATCNLRHRLVPHLEVEGGHIGYAVRPSVRGRGIGTRLLALTLVEARRMGLERVLITCDDDNVASVRVIEKNGGVPRTSSISPDSGKAVSRYCIDLTGPGHM